LANVTLDLACEEDSISLNEAEVLSVLANGTFFDEANPKIPTITPPQIEYGATTIMFNI